jgi:hypothetical protein
VPAHGDVGCFVVLGVEQAQPRQTQTTKPRHAEPCRVKDLDA